MFWIILALFAFGLQQQFWTAKVNDGFRLNFVTFVKTFWLPINLVYIPILIINEGMGKSENDIFKVINVSYKGCLIGKFFCSWIINLTIII